MRKVLPELATTALVLLAVLLVIPWGTLAEKYYWFWVGISLVLSAFVALIFILIYVGGGRAHKLREFSLACSALVSLTVIVAAIQQAFTVAGFGSLVVWSGSWMWLYWFVVVRPKSSLKVPPWIDNQRGRP